MSVLVLNVIPEGIIMGTDRLIRWGRDPNGNVGFTEGFKVLRWPNRRAMMGFVGMGDLGRRADRNSTFEWLSDFIGEHSDFSFLPELAQNLCEAVQNQFQQDGWQGDETDLLIIELTGFHLTDQGIPVPQVWHIANTHGINENTGTYDNIDASFGVSEECASRFNDVGRVRALTGQQPFWIHQTGEIGLFNSLCVNLDRFYDDRLARFGVAIGTDPPEFDRLHEFESRVRMKVLSYGAFYDSFETPISRAIGGGADVLFLEWPESGL